jgi:hypothetical protein
MIMNAIQRILNSDYAMFYIFYKILVRYSVNRNTKLIIQVVSAIRLVRSLKKDTDSLALQKRVLRNFIEERYSRTASTNTRVQLLLADLDKEINSQELMNVFILTCENILVPLQQAIANIPSNDREYTLNIAKAYLDVEGKHGLADVILLWDDLGVKGCLNAERTEIVRAFATLRVLLSNDNLKDDEKDIVLTAFVQEFERRAAQKRKTRAGGSLEDVTNFILGYYNIQRAESPEHFQADIEVDNWVKTKDGWLIGISCKRTLRERWKQVTSADASVLSKFKIKYIYHIVTYDEDLSDDKLALLGGLRHIFFLPDNSRRLKYASEHIGLKDYVKPISSLIDVIEALI